MEENKEEVILNKNPYGIIPNDIITAYNSGIHKVLDIKPNGDSLEVTYNQVYSIWGMEMNQYYPYKCDIKYCKPVVLLLPEYKKKLKQITNFVKFLENEQNKIIG